MQKRVIICVGIVALLFSIGYLTCGERRSVCVLEFDKVTLSTVFAGKFVESIPFSAGMNSDSTRRELTGELDELYFSRVSLGLTASTFIDGNDYSFLLTHKDSIIDNGRFQVTLSGPDSVFTNRLNQNLSMRLVLSEVENVVQIPVGGFYKDSGGKYVYVVLPDKRIVKRNVILGKKNPECFQVLSGLSVGDVVITSSYENFAGRDDLDLEKVQDLVDKAN